MAKLGKVQVRPAFDGRRGSLYEVDMEYTTGDKYFYIRLPKHLLVFTPPDSEVRSWIKTLRIQRTDVVVIWGDSEKEVSARANRHFAEYLHADTESRKVIIYQVLYMADQIYSPNVGSYHRNDPSFVNEKPEYTLQVDYMIATELKSGIRTTYTREVNGKIIDVSNSGPLGYGRIGLVMGWTDEREEFFRNLKESMKSMIEMVDQMVKDSDDLATKIDAGTAHLLPAPTEGN